MLRDADARSLPDVAIVLAELPRARCDRAMVLVWAFYWH